MHTFEKTDCSRCGGSGHYSWNAMTGSVCFKCNGKGTTLTKAGKAAYDEWLTIARPTVTVDEIAPGMKLRILSFNTYQVCEVACIEDDTLNVGQGRKMIRFVEGSALGGYGTVPGSTFTLAKTTESHRAAWDAMYGKPGIVEVEDEQ